MESLKIQLRVIFALLLREARVRHGRSKFGYVWTIVRPVIVISVLTILFSTVKIRSAPVASFAIFFATGVLTFQMYSGSTNYIQGSIEQNKPLFSYPPVKRLDAVIARMILDISTHLIIMTLVLLFQINFMNAPIPHDLVRMMQAVGLLVLLSFGVGLNIAVWRLRFPTIKNLYSLLMGPAFFVSGVFFSLQVMPTDIQNILTWNPIIHGVEGFRTGYFAGYHAPGLDLAYLFWFGFALTFCGLLVERLDKRDSG